MPASRPYVEIFNIYRCDRLFLAQQHHLMLSFGGSLKLNFK